MAAVSAHKTDKAKKYYTEFKELFATYARNPKLEKAMENYKEGITWLERNIPQHT
ncbi:hypothetical protein [Desulforhopalus sp. 52FAK]